MSIRKLPKIEALQLPKGLQWEETESALARWSPEIRAADDSGISILGEIGERFDGSGVTSRRISAALRNIGERDVTVFLNSPGGDFFEGVAIYNMLREHKGRVTVKVLGLAASAASIIAMAGDTVQIGKAAFLMIHNSWALVIGNRQDLAEAIRVLEPFDGAMAAVYADRTGLPVAKIEKMMEAETWMNGEDALAKGFADALLAADEIKDDGTKSASSLLRRVDSALAKQGISRAERREMLKELTGTPSAAGVATPSAGLLAALQSLNQSIQE
jgi:ATP-dependent protease ClpP protease subunit